MIKVKKIVYFIFLLSIYSLSYSGHHEKPSIKLEGIENGKTIDSSPEIISNTRLSYLPTLGGRIEIEWLKIDDYPIDERNTHFYTFFT